MTLRLPIPDKRDELGFVDASALIPALSEVKGRLHKQGFRQHGLDPVAGELLRFRNGRIQDCHGCQAYRDPRAQAAGATEDMLAAVDDYERSGLPEKHKVVLRLVDHYLMSPGPPPPELRASLLEHYPPEQVLQLVLRMTATTGNRVTRAMGLDRD